MSHLLRVAVIDGHPIFRVAVVAKLKGAGGIEIVGEGSTAPDACRIAERSAPDVMLREVVLPGGGIEAAAHIARVRPNVRIVMLTASEDEKDLASALQVGVRGYILKRSAGLEMVKTVRSIAGGDSYVAPNLAARLLINKGAGPAMAIDDNPLNLTSPPPQLSPLFSPPTSHHQLPTVFTS